MTLEPQVRPLMMSVVMLFLSACTLAQTKPLPPQYKPPTAEPLPETSLLRCDGILRSRPIKSPIVGGSLWPF